MKIVLLAAAKRGIECLKQIGALLEPLDTLSVFTFPETPWEPPFVEELVETAKQFDAKTYVTTKVHDGKFDFIWSDKVDLVLVIGWRYLIPSSIYNSATIGCFAFHDSFLPKYRGFGPTVWAIRNGESYTGASLFRITAEMDEGPIVAQQKITIGESDYIGEVVEKVTVTYLNILKEIFPLLRKNKYTLIEQDHSLATYTCKSLPTDFKINWNENTKVIYNYIRAYSAPYPGAYCYLDGKKLTIWVAEIDRSKRYVGLVPGRVITIEDNVGVRVATNDGVILLKYVQIENGNKTGAATLIKKISTTLN